MTPPQIMKRFIVIVLLFSMCSAFFIPGSSTALADGNSGPGSGDEIDKCSPDLLAIANENGASRVKVIVQSSARSGLLDSLLGNFGGILLATFPQLNAKLVDISAASAKAMATRRVYSFTGQRG